MVYAAAEKTWRSTTFRAESKYVVSKSDRAGEAFEVKRIGQSFAGYRCKQSFNEYGYLECDGLGQFAFNKRNGRFLVTYTIAYMNVGIGPELTDANSDTPSIEIGKCSPF